jgi:hypothetical protein
MELTFLSFWQGLSFLSVIFGIYFILIAWEMNVITGSLLGVTVFNLPGYILSSGKNYKFDDSILQDEIKEMRSILEKPGVWAQLRIDQALSLLWHKIDEVSYFRINCLNGHVYALILWGFAGTIYGAIGSFQALGLAFEQGVAPGQAIQLTLKEGLSLALVSSLLASFIAAGVVFIKRFLLQVISDYERFIQTQLANIFKDSEGMENSFKNSHNTIPD